jgi:hypothetical protein
MVVCQVVVSLIGGDVVYSENVRHLVPGVVLYKDSLRLQSPQTTRTEYTNGGSAYEELTLRKD